MDMYGLVNNSHPDLVDWQVQHSSFYVDLYDNCFQKMQYTQVCLYFLILIVWEITGFKNNTFHDASENKELTPLIYIQEKLTPFKFF